VHADTEIDALVSGKADVRISERSLRLHGALHRVDGASKFGKNTVARSVRYAAPVIRNEPVEDCPPLGQSFERADLVVAHETAVALDICCEDRDEASADCHRV